eukprot:5192777-Prorocentrum_lima.AAC.1
MTSSLVGSEMCIRDRLRSNGLIERMVGIIKDQMRRVLHAAFEVGPTFWPVSYTHLTLPTICSV